MFYKDEYHPPQVMAQQVGEETVILNQGLIILA